MRLGIDIGGNSVKSGLVDENGQIVSSHSFPVDISITADEICEKISFQSNASLPILN